MNAGRGWNAEADRKKFEAWATKMTHGRFAEAWTVNDLEHKHWPSAHQQWDGKALTGRPVCVSSLHGLGDTVQMLQYAPALSHISGNVLFRLPRAMLCLARYFDGVDQVEALDENSASCHHRARVEMMELPYLFRTRLDDFPIATGYLDRTGFLRKVFAPRINSNEGRLLVGIASQGSTWDEARWISFPFLRPLLKVPGVSITFLQGFPLGMPLHEQTPNNLFAGSLEELAGFIANLDLVVSADTLSAHVAGALGVPCLLLLKYEADWRWQHAGVKTPWYPRTCLFRQTRPDDWTQPIEEVAQVVLNHLRS